MKVGFIGTGFMGKPMAHNILKVGHEMTVFDAIEDAANTLVSAGASWASGPREVAETSEVVFTSLPGPSEVEAVALGPGGLIEGLAAGSIYVDLSTTRPSLIQEIGKALETIEVAVMDAPVSGGAAAAQNGTLAIWAGGTNQVYEQVKPILGAIGDKPMFCGPLGSGLVCKLCNNLLSISLLALIPEVFTAGVKAGVPASTLLKAISSGSGDTAMMRRNIPRIMARDFSASVGAGIIQKDVALGVEMGQELGVPMEITEAVLERLREADEHGHGGQPARRQEQRAGVEIRD